ncbi:hypothetical protein, partial [Xenorhabdus bovienii]|uniref:hypothetical protein n=1 Tax=Xenorhabdus bovienii TaxID=40576 RepID=UPI002158019F
HGYAYIINEIWDDCIREKIPLPQYNSISASSMYEARIKLPDNAIKTIYAINLKMQDLKSGNYLSTGW